MCLVIPAWLQATPCYERLGETRCTHLFPSIYGDVDVFENQVQVFSVTQAVVSEFHSAHLRPVTGRSHLLHSPGSLWGGEGRVRNLRSVSGASRLQVSWLHILSDLITLLWLPLLPTRLHYSSNAPACPASGPLHPAWKALPQTPLWACSLTCC